MPMIEPLFQSFMQKAVIAGILIAIICPIIGAFIIIKRLTMIGDTVAHIVLAAFALSSLLKIINNIYLTYIIPLLATIIIFKLTKESRFSGEQALVIVLSFFAALTSIFISLGGRLNFEAVLFGSILFLSWRDIYLIFTITICITFMLLLRLRSFLLYVFDEDAFYLTGKKGELYELLLGISVSLVVVASVSLMGVLLVSAILTIPVLSSMQIARSFGKTLAISIVIAELAVVVGIFGSYYSGLAPGGLIVIILLIIFSSLMIIGKTGLRI